jgi:hypothetical protein
MTDQEKKEETTTITPQPDAEKKKTELGEEELKKVTGGSESVSLNFTKIEPQYKSN